jgi:hypothetical protein
MKYDRIGAASGLLLLGSLGAQCWKQWTERTTQGVSRLFFVGQIRTHRPTVELDANRLRLSPQKVDDINAAFREIYMATRRTRKSKSLTVKSMELALSVPQVFAHRVTRMALAGPQLSDRDRKEFQIMLTEKHAAFAHAWSDMATHAFRENQAFTAYMLRFFFAPLSLKRRSAASTAAQVHRAAIGVFGKGLAPIHRKAVSNARRLAKTRLC